MNAPTVLIADDHQMFAQGLKQLLTPKFEVVGIVEDGRSLVEEAKRLHPNVIVADITMPHWNGIEALEELKKTDPKVRFVFLTMHRELAFARRALEAGAMGFVLKHSAPEELVVAIGAALNGQKYVTPPLVDAVLGASHRKRGSDPMSSLTLRQREILELLAKGNSAKEVAAVLGISIRTVEYHKYAMMQAVGIHSSAELIHFAIREGLLEL